MYNLTGRRVLVTGGSRGLGAAIAAAFAREGAKVAITYLNSSGQAERVATEIQKLNGQKPITIAGVSSDSVGMSVVDPVDTYQDLAKTETCEKVIEEAASHLGGLDVVVSNAGNTKIAPFEDVHALSEEDWDHTWNILVKANVFLLRAALPYFKKNADGGSFLMQSSIAGLFPNGSSMAYSVCRAAQLHLMQCLAQTQGPMVRVNAITPGLVDTERGSAFTQEQRKGFMDMAALKRITTTEEIAAAFIFAARNSGLTGERLRIDSGMIIR